MSLKYLGISSVINYNTLLSSIYAFTSVNKISGTKFLRFWKGNSLILIPQDVIATNLSWDEFNTAGIVQGKNITISGKTYFCRLMTGGNSATDSCDWNEFLTPIRGQLSNDFRMSALTICKEMSGSRLVLRGGRPYPSYGTFDENLDRYLTSYSSSTKDSNLGLRPILIVDTILNNSLSNSHLGDIAIWENVEYTITGGTFNLTVKVNETEIINLENQTDGTPLTLDLSTCWNELPYGKHSIEIIGVDKNNAPCRTTITFNKTKHLIPTIPTSSSLKQVIEHSNEIKKEIEFINDNLEQILITKGIEIPSVDKNKTRNLLNKIRDFV